jgi:hypothetical protein
MYNLLITAQPGAWKKNVYEYERSRSVREYTDDAISERFKGFTKNDIEELMLSISIFSVVYFSIDVARGEQTIANTPSERPKTKFPLSMRLPDPADGDIHY